MTVTQKLLDSLPPWKRSCLTQIGSVDNWHTHLPWRRDRVDFQEVESSTGYEPKSVVLTTFSWSECGTHVGYPVDTWA